MIIAKCLLAFSLLTSIHSVENVNAIVPPPEIIDISTDFPSDGIWVQIPMGTKKITFTVNTEHTETVLFWLMPTGTETWNQRKLIGYDIKENENDKIFTLTWKIDRPYLLDHLHIQALGNGIAGKTVNLIMEE